VIQSPAASTNAGAPRHMALLESRTDLGSRTSFDLVVRHVGALEATRVPAYTALDARLAWRPHRELELAVVGQNLFDAHHPEFGPEATRSEVRRGLYGSVAWRP
jgi:iron complex outermembrane receptor protein